MVNKDKKVAHRAQMGAENILITGGCGFVGINLVRYLVRNRKCRLTLFDDLSNAVPENLDTVCQPSEHDGGKGKKPDLVVGDLCDLEICNRAVRGHDAVVHLAAYTRVSDSLLNPERCFAVNVQGTLNLLEACRQCNVKKFVFASSNAAVGESISLVNEKTAPRPLSPYGASKLAGEASCSAYTHSFGVRTVALRFSNAYGPFCQKKSSVVAKFMRQLLADETLTVYGDGRQTRDFIHVADLCRVIALCLDLLNDEESSKGVAGEVFQVATGRETNILELVSLLERVMSCRSRLHFLPPRRGEIVNNRSDITKLGERLKYIPEISIETGVAELYEWFRTLRSDGLATRLAKSIAPTE